MIYAEAALLTCLLFFGTSCAITDFRTGIIPNRYILYGFGVALLLHIPLLIWETAYYPGWLLNMAIADLLAFLMFCSQMWAAGDAKLFFLMYFCLPPRLFDGGVLSLSVTPFILIFIPAFCWILVDTTVRLIRKEPRKKQVFSWKKWIMNCITVVLEATVFYYALRQIFPDFAADNPLFSAVLMMVYAYLCASIAFMKKWYVLVIHVVILAAIVIFGREVNFIPNWKSYLVMLMALGLQRITSMYNYQQIPTADVRAGMIPAAETVLLFQTSQVHSLPVNGTEEMRAKITEEEAAAVRRWETSARGQPQIWIVRKMPFALYILLGFTIWAAIRLVGVI